MLDWSANIKATYSRIAGDIDSIHRAYQYTGVEGCPRLFSPLWDMSAPHSPLRYNQDHSCMTLCFLQSDPYPRAYSQTEACLGPHISPDQNLRMRENMSETEIQLSSYLKHGLCYYVVRLKLVTGNEGELKKIYSQQNHSQRISLMRKLMLPLVSSLLFMLTWSCSRESW